MDASVMSSSPGCKKLKMDENVDAADDRISKLHDMVLHHILSFLPTTDAVRTCILSKRFDNMWTSLPNLQFRNTKGVKRDLFMNFVERVLTHRDVSSLHEFTLDCVVHGDVTRISTWISAVIRRNVQVLRTSLLKIKASLVLPLCLFNSNSLVELELSMAHVLTLPTSICFSSLKKLTLRLVIFPNDHLTQQFFSGCPVLEELQFDECNLVNLRAVTISCPGLKRFTICESAYEDAQGDSECQIMILSTILEYFHCQGELRNDYILSSTSSIVHACLYILSDGEPEGVRKVAYRLHKLLKVIPNATKLELSSRAFQVYRFAEELFMDVPVFKSLTRLDFYMNVVRLDLDGLHKILQNSPHLESLNFADGIDVEFGDSETGDQIFSPVPSCFASHLKDIRIDDFTGCVNEIAAVKILLAYASVLEKMVIVFNIPNMGLQQMVRELLLLLPRSSACSIVFR